MRVLFIAMIVVLTVSGIDQAAETRKKSRTIESLNLSPKAKKAAEQLLKKYPDIVFTSGRRDLAGQARAMAGNLVKKRDWIEKTYASNEASKACEKWVDDHPEAKTQKQIAAGLLVTLKGLGPKVGQISRHLTGDAFDIQPVKKNPDEVKKSIKELPGVKQFLDHEGGLEIWHVGF
jgi:transcription initiation factor TFIIIB Brf1 subunit/transcription initiation factor TFIIB